MCKISPRRGGTSHNSPGIIPLPSHKRHGPPARAGDLVADETQPATIRNHDSMIRLVFNKPANIETQREYNAAVVPGVLYLMTNYHVGRCVPRSACSEAAPYESDRPYEGEPLGTRSLLIHWLAGLGDTLTFAPALLSLQANNADARIDILTIPVLFEILAAAGFKGNMIKYPAEVDTVERYDCFLPLEEDSKDPDYLHLGSIDFRAKQLHQPQGLGPASFQIDDATREKVRLPAGALIRVGIQVRGLSPIRTYPSDLLAEVLRGLVRHGYEVHLLGGPGDCPARRLPRCSSMTAERRRISPKP